MPINSKESDIDRLFIIITTFQKYSAWQSLYKYFIIGWRNVEELKLLENLKPKEQDKPEMAASNSGGEGIEKRESSEIILRLEEYKIAFIVEELVEIYVKTESEENKIKILEELRNILIDLKIICGRVIKGGRCKNCGTSINSTRIR